MFHCSKRPWYGKPGGATCAMMSARWKALARDSHFSGGCWFTQTKSCCVKSGTGVGEGVVGVAGAEAGGGIAGFLGESTAPARSMTTGAVRALRMAAVFASVRVP